MIEVYFEYKGHAELVATFEDEDVYDACSSALEEEASKGGMILTESVEDEVIHTFATGSVKALNIGVKDRRFASVQGEEDE
jgi:hypothetical protein